MKRFRFSLEKALELRQYREQEAKNELGRAIGILTGIENNIKQNALVHRQATQQRFAEINAGNAAATSGAATGGAAAESAHSMRTWDSYINRLEHEAQRLMEEAAQAEIVVEEKRNLYLEASRELKVMENLKEKREKEHRKEVFAAETRELDDMRRSPAASTL